MTGIQNPLLDDFFRLKTKEERNAFFRIRNEAERSRIYPLLAEDERLSLSMLLDIEQPFHSCIVYRLIGNTSLGMSSLNRSFSIEPTGKGPKDGVKYEAGSRDGKRRFLTLKSRQQLPAALALNLLHTFGPNSTIDYHRGWVKEVVTEYEIAEPTPPEQTFTLAQVQQLLDEQRAKMLEAPAAPATPSKKPKTKGR